MANRKTTPRLLAAKAAGHTQPGATDRGTMSATPEKLPDNDTYYMGIALAVRARANCKGNRVGAVAVLVMEDQRGEWAVTTLRERATVPTDGAATLPSDGAVVKATSARRRRHGARTVRERAPVQRTSRLATRRK